LSEDQVLRCKKFISNGPDNEELFYVFRDVIKQELVVDKSEGVSTKTKDNTMDDIDVKDDTTWVVDENQAMYNCNVWIEEQNISKDVSPENGIIIEPGIKVEIEPNMDECLEASSYNKTASSLAIAEFQDEKLAIAEEPEDELENKNNETNLSQTTTSISFDEKLNKINSVIQNKNPRCNVKSDQLSVCKYCGKKTLYLRTHELRMHGNDNNKSFPCQLCEKVFHFNHELKNHQSRKHENHRPAVCDICAKAFYANDDLKRHQRRVHEKHKPCVCDICGKGFTQKSHLDKHKVIHTGERNYPCKEEGCGKSFKQRWHLVQHERLHTGVKPYQCKYCEVKFRQKSSLDSHIKIHKK